MAQPRIAIVLTILLALYTIFPSILINANLIQINDIDHYCLSPDSSICRLQFITDSGTVPLSFASLPINSVLDLIIDPSRPSQCSITSSGFIVTPSADKPSTIECAFQKLSTGLVAASASPFGPQFPPISFFSTPLDFTPDLASTCSDPTSQEPCTGTINIPGSGTAFVLETTSPTISIQCDNNVNTTPSTLINAAALVPVYRTTFTTLNSSIELNKCKVTFGKENIKYTPHFELSVSNHVLYHSDAILLNNLFIYMENDCNDGSKPLCTLSFETPELPQTDSTFTVLLDSTLKSYKPMEKIQTIDKVSTYTQKFIKPITPQHLDPSMISDTIINITPTSRYLYGRNYKLPIPSLKYIDVININYDKTICADPSIPTCRLLFTTQYIGPAISFRFDKFPFGGVVDRIQCNSKQFSTIIDRDWIEIILQVPMSPSSTIVTPENNVYDENDNDPHQWNSQEEIKCWIDIAIGANTLYPLTPQDYLTTDSYRIIGTSRWNAFPVTFPYAPALSTSSDIIFNTIPWEFSYGTDCADSSHPWCSLVFTISEENLPVQQAMTKYLRSFSINLQALELLNPDDIITNNHITVEITGSDFIYSDLNVVLDPDNAGEAVLDVIVTTDFTDLESAASASPTNTIPYYSISSSTPQGQGLITVKIRYRLTRTTNLVPKTLNLLSYNNVPVTNQIIISQDYTGSISYIPLFTTESSNCNDEQFSFCNVEITPADSITSIDQFYFTIDSATILGPNTDHTPYLSCIADDNNIIDGVPVERLGFLCSIDSSLIDITAEPIILQLDKRLTILSHYDTVFSIKYYNDEIALDGHYFPFKTSYTGDGRAIYGSNCRTQLSFRCDITFRFYTVPVYAETTLLKHEIPYDESTFLHHKLDKCVGLTFSDGTVPTAAQFNQIFSYSLYEDGLFSFSTNPIPPSLSSRWSESSPLILDSNLPSEKQYFECLIRTEKSLQTGRTGVSTIPLIINGVDLASKYRHFFIPLRREISYSSELLRYHPFSIQPMPDCQTPVREAVVCSLQLTTYGSLGSPFKSWKGSLRGTAMRDNAILSIFMRGGEIKRTHDYLRYLGLLHLFTDGGLPYTTNELVYSGVDENNLPILVAVKSVMHLYLTTTAQIGDTSVGKFVITTPVSEAVDFQDVEINFEIYDNYQEIVLRSYFVQIYAIDDILWGAMKFHQNALLGYTMTYEVTINDDEDVPQTKLLAKLPSMSMGTLIRVHPQLHQINTPNTIVPTRFLFQSFDTLTKTGTTNIIIHTILSDKVIYCYNITESQDVNTPVYSNTDEAVILATLTPDFNTGTTKVYNLIKSPIDPVGVPTGYPGTCVANITVNRLYPTKSIDVLHELYFDSQLRQQSTDSTTIVLPHQAYQSYPTYHTSSGIIEIDSDEVDNGNDGGGSNNDGNNTSKIGYNIYIIGIVVISIIINIIV